MSADALTFANLGIEPRPMEDWLWEITRDHRKVTFYFAFYFGRCCICQRVDSVSALLNSSSTVESLSVRRHYQFASLCCSESDRVLQTGKLANEVTHTEAQRFAS